MQRPCIKGMTLLAVVEDVKRLREQGRISGSDLEARLEPEELSWLEEKIQPALWYGIDGYRRLTELLLELDGRGHPDYLVRRGAIAARRLLDSGLYAQLRHGEERLAEVRAGGREIDEHDGRLMTTLSSSIFNFGSWRYYTDGDDAVIEARDVDALPEVSRLAARGLIGAIVSHLRERPIEVDSQRPEPGRVTFRFSRR